MTMTYSVAEAIAAINDNGHEYHQCPNHDLCARHCVDDEPILLVLTEAGHDAVAHGVFDFDYWDPRLEGEGL